MSKSKFDNFREWLLHIQTVEFSFTCECGRKHCIKKGEYFDYFS